jgi:hypothetical protein
MISTRSDSLYIKVSIDAKLVAYILAKRSLPNTNTGVGGTQVYENQVKKKDESAHFILT